MSNGDAAWSQEDDLIDFAGSSEFARHATRLVGDVPETLLDSEVLRLEETLQNATPSHTRSPSGTVELDQVLITIEDEADKAEDIAEVLRELDKILKESEDSEEEKIEECLRELDSYLQGFDTSEEISDEEQEFGNLGVKLKRLVSRTKSLRHARPIKDEGRPNSAEWGGIVDRALLRRSFRTLPRKRAKQDDEVSTGIVFSPQVVERKLSLSADALLEVVCASDTPGDSDTFVSCEAEDASRQSSHSDVSEPCQPEEPVGAFRKNSYRRLSNDEIDPPPDEPSPHTSLQDVLPEDPSEAGRSNRSQNPSLERNVFKFGRVPHTDVDSDEEIDWSWVQDVSGEPTDASVQTGSLPPQETEAVTASTSDPPINKTRAHGSWLRSSMRRVQHFRLPSDPEAGDAPPEVPNRVPQRPLSAPGRTSDGGTRRSRSRSRSRESSVSREPGGRARSSSASSRSRRRPRSLSSSESSLASSVDSTPSCTPGVTPSHAAVPEPVAAASPRRSCDRPSHPEMPDQQSPLGQWPHSLSSMLACLGCTLGLFNLSRFATLTVRFGANFIVQFLALSLVFGIPLFTLQLCLGQQLSAGVVDMWKISPLFQGVGVALLAAQAMIGMYSIVGISWMLIYFRDSFITKQDQYKWAQPFEYYRDGKSLNSTFKISDTVPAYFSGVVLQRHNLLTSNSFGSIKFQVVFNLAVVWMIVFVSLSKGLRSYAKVVYAFTLLPIFGTFILCAKLIGLNPSNSLHELFPETSWNEFFLNSKSWIAAGQETFLTWGLLGAAVMQIASHNKHKHLLQRHSSLVIILTITVLLLTAFVANTCMEILHFYGYNYMPNSFEQMSTYVFLRSSRESLPPSLSGMPVRYMTHSSFVIGERVLRPGMDRTVESGYQVLRFATELVPATLALLGPQQISPFWAVLFYFIVIMFGIAQQLAIWHCVITGIMAIKAKVLKSWETTITFFTCTIGFVLGLPMTTELGIFVVYFLDYTIGGVWWLIFVYLVQIIAVFMVRGRPYSGDTVVTALFTSTSSSWVQTWIAPLLPFVWNVILPVALITTCITNFKSGQFRELFVWHYVPSLEYWPAWKRQLGSMLQLLPIVCIPVVAIIQSYRYLNNGPPDILDRIQLLYRPPMDSEHMNDLTVNETTGNANNASTTTVVSTIPAEDPPPKYTPPPSYTTATGARLAKLLRQSIRRSVRRLANVLGETSTPRTVDRAQLQIPPPDYSAVLVEMNQTQIVPHAVDIEAPVDRISREIMSLQGSPLTAADVACILRSSFRRSTIRNNATLRRNVADEVPSGSLSAQCLVDGIAPIGEDSLVLETISQSDELKTNDNLSSVI